MTDDKANTIGWSILGTILGALTILMFIMIGVHIEQCGRVYKCEDLYVKCAQGQCNETELTVEKACRASEKKP